MWPIRDEFNLEKNERKWRNFTYLKTVIKVIPLHNFYMLLEKKMLYNTFDYLFNIWSRTIIFTVFSSLTLRPVDVNRFFVIFF